MDNNRFKCEHCAKNYATKDGIHRHSTSAHHMRYDRRNGRTTALTAAEIPEEMQKLHRKQYRGKDRASFVPSSETGRKRRQKKTQPVVPAFEDVSSDSTVSVDSITFHLSG